MTAPIEAGSRLSAALRAERLALLAECLPPRGPDADALNKCAAALPQWLDAVVVPDGGSELRTCALAAAALLAQQGREPVLCLATRDRNRIALCSDALGAAALGIANLLCLSGEHQTQGECPQAAGVFDVDSVQLLDMLKDGMHEPGPLLGALAHPGLRPPAFAAVDLRKKVDAGARFLLTDPLFDADGFAAWMQTAREAGIVRRCSIIASVEPLESTEQAEKIKARRRGVPIPDEVMARLAGGEDGVALCAEIAAQVACIEGVCGVHIACGGREEAAAEVIERASLRKA